MFLCTLSLYYEDRTEIARVQLALHTVQVTKYYKR